MDFARYFFLQFFVEFFQLTSLFRSCSHSQSAGVGRGRVIPRPANFFLFACVGNRHFLCALTTPPSLAALSKSLSASRHFSLSRTTLPLTFAHPDLLAPSHRICALEKMWAVCVFVKNGVWLIKNQINFEHLFAWQIK